MSIKIVVLLVIVLVVATIFWWVRTNEVKNPGPANQISRQAQVPSATYAGVLPCADCSGLQTTLKLYLNGDQPSNYEMTFIYNGKNVAPLVENGTWSILSGQGASRTLVMYKLTSENGGTQMFLVEGNTLHLVDADENVLPSSIPSTLQKVK